MTSFSLHSQGYLDVTVFKADSIIQANVDNENFVILDVRTPSEYDRDHLVNAYTRNFYDDDFSQQMDSLNKDLEYLIYCASGNRSGQAFIMMQNLNFNTVYNMLGGITSWKNNNFSVTTEVPPFKNLYLNDQGSFSINATLELEITNLNGSEFEEGLILLSPLDENVNIEQTGVNAFSIQSNDSTAMIELCAQSLADPAMDVSALDIIRSINIILDKVTPCEQNILASDVNEDGKTSALDLVEMLNIIIGRSEGFSIGTAHRIRINGELASCINIKVNDIPESVEIVAIKKGDLPCVDPKK